MNILLIGDVHGKVKRYQSILRESEYDLSIQLGDFGFQKEHDWHLSNVDSDTNRILFGNHDYLPYVDMGHSVGDVAIIEDSIFLVRGADSIDKNWRRQGIDWWPEEELAPWNWEVIAEKYETTKPRIVLSHDCPQSFYPEVCMPIPGLPYGSRTSQGLQSLLDLHRPELWVFGHHHKSITKAIDGTTFRCLAELETMEIEV